LLYRRIENKAEKKILRNHAAQIKARHQDMQVKYINKRGEILELNEENKKTKEKKKIKNKTLQLIKGTFFFFSN
jgi:hypothetical protein